MSLEAAVARATGRAVRSLQRVGGGDINDAYAAELEDGGRAFVKTRAGAPAGEYAAEAAGLRWLDVPNGARRARGAGRGRRAAGAGVARAGRGG